MSTILIILNDAPYGSERTCNGLRLAGALAGAGGHDLRLFLLGDSVVAAKAGQKVPSGYYSVEVMLGAVVRGGWQVGALRHLPGCPRHGGRGDYAGRPAGNHEPACGVDRDGGPGGGVLNLPGAPSSLPDCLPSRRTFLKSWRRGLAAPAGW